MDKPESPFQNKAIKGLLKEHQIFWALGYLSALAGWDLHTYMPVQGAAERGLALSKIGTLAQKMFTDKKFVKLVHNAAKQKGLNDYEKAVVHNLKRSLKIYEKLPSSLLEEITKTTNEAQIVWQEARLKNNFKLFQPFLQKLINLSIKEAEKLGYKNEPYDALLDLYEEAWTAKEVQLFFQEIAPQLKEILKRVQKKKDYMPVHPLEKIAYDRDELEKINDKVLQFFQADFKRMRIDTSAHPFTQYIGYDDTRITTRYRNKNFASSISSTVHEFGHALHHMQCDEALSQTPACSLNSLGMGESQSRFWENFIGKNMEFIKFFYKDFLRLNPKMGRYTKKDFYNYFNTVRPGLIRVESDEITYHFHIKLRFEVERGLISKKIKVKDLPEIWREEMKKNLGVEPKIDSEGVLQDVHWSMGAFGYFPTYSLGTFLSGIWKEEIERDLGDLGNLTNRKGIPKIKNWLKQKIHRFGGVYTTKEVLQKVSQKKFSPQPLLKYLKKKYLSNFT